MDTHTLGHVVPAMCEWCVYVAALVAVGGMLFLAFVHDRRRPEQASLARVVVVAALIGGLATIVTVALQAWRITGQPGAMHDISLLTDVLESGYGRSALLRLAGLTALILAVARLAVGRAMVALGVLAALLTASSFVTFGHSAVAEPRTLVVVATAAHVVASAAWFGGLVLLRTLLGHRAELAPGTTPVVLRFSSWAFVSVGVLGAAGLTLAWVHGRSPAALAGTAYGAVLLAKVLVVVAILGVAAYNRWRLVPAIRADDAAAWRRLRTTVGTEAVAVGLVVAVTAALINLPPPTLHDPSQAGARSPGQEVQGV